MESDPRPARTDAHRLKAVREAHPAVPILECRRALDACGGDVGAAIQELERRSIERIREELGVGDDRARELQERHGSDLDAARRAVRPIFRSYFPSASQSGCALLLALLPALVGTYFIPCHFIVLSRELPAERPSVEMASNRPVRAEVYPCLLLAIPRARWVLPRLEETRSKVEYGETTTTRNRDGTESRVRSEDKGTLFLAGEHPADLLTVSVSPAMLRGTESSIDGFLADPSGDRKVIYTVTNWKFGFLAMLPFCLLTLYLPLAFLVRTARAALERLLRSRA